MNWDNKKYHFYLLFVDVIKGKEPWTKKEWDDNIQPVFNKIIQLSIHYKKTSLDVLAYKQRPNSEYFDKVKFGKLEWDEKSFNKWTISDDNKDLNFHALNCWTPRRAECEKTDSPPDIYFNIWNEKRLPLKDKIKFDSMLVIAISEELDYKASEEILELSKILNTKRTVYKIRPWGRIQDPEKKDKWIFINSIQDTNSFGIYRGGSLDIHDIKFEELEFEPYWTSILT